MEPSPRCAGPMNAVRCFALLLVPVCLAADELRPRAETALARGVAFFRTLSTQGGYVYAVTPDLSGRWGEVPADANTIEVQPPGTPAVGLAFLRAYEVTRDPVALEAARAAADALIRGQNKHGGWDHTINFADLRGETVSFDDNQTQSALSFLLALNRVVTDERLAAATRRALDMMIRVQLENGGWPHLYPPRGNYHDYATFNDGCINDCVRVMLEAHRIDPGDKAIERSLRRAARFITISQQSPPQPGWAQQYTPYLQPAWARSFEPASLCPAVTVRNIGTLIDLFVALGDETLLEPIPDALRWLGEIRLPNGKWARFVEIGTNKPLYYDRGRIRVSSVEQLHPERSTGYAYETDLASAIAAAARRYERAGKLGREGLRRHEQPEISPEAAALRLRGLAGAVEKVLESQHASGAWITPDDRFKTLPPGGARWNGEYAVMDRIQSAVFNRNVAVLCDYLELTVKAGMR
jgi:hypothetical protein